MRTDGKQLKRQVASMLQRPNPLAYSSFYSGHDSSNDEEEARRREVINELDELNSRQEQISK